MERDGEARGSVAAGESSVPGDDQETTNAPGHAEQSSDAALATGDTPRVREDGRDPSAEASPEQRASDGPDVEVIEHHTSNRALLGELVPEIALLAISIYLFVLAGSFQNQADPGQLGPGFWPRMAALGLGAALVARMVQMVRSRNRPIVKVHSEFDEFDEAPDFHWGQLGVAMALAVGYVLATMFLGYLLSTALFLGAWIWLGGQRKWYVPLVAVGGALVLTYVFIGIVYVSLPTGVGIFDTISVALYRLLGIQ